jgi:hypothetical protein
MNPQSRYNDVQHNAVPESPRPTGRITAAAECAVDHQASVNRRLLGMLDRMRQSPPQGVSDGEAASARRPIVEMLDALQKEQSYTSELLEALDALI